MRIVLDANILLRLTQRTHAMHRTTLAAVDALSERHEPVLCTQSLVEFFVVATRPATTKANGLGYDLIRAANERDRFAQLFPLLPEPVDLYIRWRGLVDHHQTKGKAAHDARYAAFMIGSGITSLLTYNISDFRRYRQITVRTPDEIVAGQTF